MPEVAVLPIRGGILLDARGSDRALRVSWHHEAGLVVLSLWRTDRCIGSFRLRQTEVPQLVHALVAGLSEGYQAPQSPAVDAG